MVIMTAQELIKLAENSLHKLRGAHMEDLKELSGQIFDLACHTHFTREEFEAIRDVLDRVGDAIIELDRKLPPTPHFVVYIGNVRDEREHESTFEDIRNVSRVLSSMDLSKCYTHLHHNGKYIGQAEHVLPSLVAIGYIPDGALEQVEGLLGELGVTEYQVYMFADEAGVEFISSRTVRTREVPVRA